MSYDVYFIDPKTKEVAECHHDIRGGTFAVGGSTEAHLNITYNYSGIFTKVFGDGGIRNLYDKKSDEVIIMLTHAIMLLEADETEDYWEATEGNARRALLNLRMLAVLNPDCVLTGD